jgi:hypothetical protein
MWLAAKDLLKLNEGEEKERGLSLRSEIIQKISTGRRVQRFRHYHTLNFSWRN